MPKTTKVIIGLVVVLLVVWGIYSKTSQPKQTSAEPIKLGVIAPLTGNLAFIGEAYRDGFLLAKDELKNTKYQYELLFEDDYFDSKKTATAANKLLSVDKVEALATIASGAGNVVNPLAEQFKVAQLATASDQNVAKGYYNFIHWTPPAEEVRIFVAELQKRGIKKLGIFEVNQQGVADIVKTLRKKIEGTGIEIVTDQLFNPGEKDFRSLIGKAKNSGAEIYLLEAFSPDIEVIARQIKEAGITTPLSAIEAFELTEQMQLFEGYWYVNAADPTGDFTEKFKKKFGKNPGFGSANGYDIFKMIVTTAEKSKVKPNAKEIAKQLYNIGEINGALGKLTMDENGVVLSKAVVRTIKEGKPVTISD